MDKTFAMKKTITLGIGLVLTICFTSCEKSYTCTCTYPNSTIGTTETTFKAKKQSDAQASCAALNANAQANGGACAL
jgi:hypothetical protein